MRSIENLRMRWFIFYTKVRPWFGILFNLLAVVVLVDGLLMQRTQLNLLQITTTCVWIFIALLSIAVQIILFVNTCRKSCMLLYYIKLSLVFDYFTIILNYLSEITIDAEATIVAIVVLVISGVFWYFVWYRINLKYFRQRIGIVTKKKFDETNNDVASTESFNKACGSFFVGLFAKNTAYEYLDYNKSIDAENYHCIMMGYALAYVEAYQDGWPSNLGIQCMQYGSLMLKKDLVLRDVSKIRDHYNVAKQIMTREFTGKVKNARIQRLAECICNFYGIRDNRSAHQKIIVRDLAQIYKEAKEQGKRARIF